MFVRRCFAWLAVVVCSSAASPPKPDFSGTWKMNPERSSFGQLPKPDSLVRKIEHKEPKIHSITTQTGAGGTLTTESRLVTGGTEQINQIGAFQVRSRARWQGAELLVDSRRQVRDIEVETHEKWSLSEDGKTLTVVTRVRLPAGESEITVVLEKQ